MKDIQFLGLVIINVAENQLYIVECLLIAVFLSKSLTSDYISLEKSFQI
jgi:hypothetical protein